MGSFRFNPYTWLLLAATLVFMPAAAQTRADDNVVLVDGVETWELVAPAAGKDAYVKNTIAHTYEATRYRESIQPFALFNNRMRLDKASGKGKARYESASSRNVFHDDNRVCYFDMYLEGPGKKAKVRFERTLTDPAFFTRVFLPDEYPIRHKELRISVPPSYPGITVEERNFTPSDGGPISRRIDTAPDGTRTWVYTISGLEGTLKQEDEPSTVAPRLYQPMLLIKGWFGTMADLYAWHADMGRVDTAIPDIGGFLASEVYQAPSDALTSRQKLDKIYAWVQRNIRYIAYEEGESGHRPDTPAEVIRKRYGDCKGMALLLATLLRHEGFDARAAIIGTTDIPDRIADVPSIGSADHSICVVADGADTLFLDATATYIPARHIPGSLQGKDVLVLAPSGEAAGCRMVGVPVLSPRATALDSVSYVYSLSADRTMLRGTATRTLGGDYKEAFLSHYDDAGAKYAAERMAVDLVPLRRSVISPDSVSAVYDGPGGVAVISAPIVNTEAVTDAQPSVYVDMNASNGIAFDRIDNTDRRSPYRLPGRGRIVRHTRISLPAGARVTYLPEAFSLVTPQASMECIWSEPEPGVVEMRKAVSIVDPVVAVSAIEDWNSAVARWNTAANSQIEISF